MLVELRKAWRNGTTHLLLEPIELLEKLAALTLRPEVHSLLYHSVLAPQASRRRQVVGSGTPSPPNEDPAQRTGGTARPRQLRYWA